MILHLTLFVWSNLDNFFGFFSFFVLIIFNLKKKLNNLKLNVFLKINREDNIDILKDETSPFPVHEENLIKMRNYEKRIAVDSTTTQMTNNNYNTPSISKPLIQVPPSINTTPAFDQVDNQKFILTSKTTTELILTTETIEPLSPIQRKGEMNVAPKTVLFEQTKREKRISRYESLSFDLDMSKPFSINISHYEHPNLFFAQLNVSFMEFDVFYDEFQASCDQADRVEVNDLKLALSNRTLSNLALAAKFHDDNCWYRARIVVDEELNKAIASCANTNDNLPVLIEFIDYGNTQKTPIKECVFLSEQFASFKPCAVKCNGVAYLDTVLNLNKIKDNAVSNLLFYSRIEDKRDDEPIESKSTHDQVYFVGNFFLSFWTYFISY
jgi:hypothetical protein